MHKGVFPILHIEALGYFAVFLMVMYANWGGAAGAGFVLPISMYFFGFDFRNSVAQSLASIAVSSIVRYVQNFN